MFNKKLVFGAACAGMLLFGVGLITLGSVSADLKQKFGLDGVTAGTLFSILPFGILTGSLLFGPVCDRYGYRRLLAASGLIMSVGFGGIAFAGDLELLKTCIFFFGAGSGAINGATNALVADISSTGKGANLSILGVFFGIGALGMPVVLGLLKGRFSFETVLTLIAVLTLALSLFILFIPFPAPKRQQGFPLKQSFSLARDGLLVMVAFFLFLQSGFEALVNNWTTLLLVEKFSVAETQALYALSLYVAGMAGMRLLTGSLFRNIDGFRILLVSFGLIGVGLLLTRTASTLAPTIPGLILTGAGLAGGFPIMLGIVGHRYTRLSGTAFSFVLVIALLGNMLINYLAGLITQHYGIRQVVNLEMAELAGMIILCLFIKRSLTHTKHLNQELC